MTPSDDAPLIDAHVHVVPPGLPGLHAFPAVRDQAVATSNRGDIKLETDFYQPLDAAQNYYIDPFLGYQQYDLDLYNDSYGESSSFRVRQAGFGVEVDRNLERWGRLSLGLF